MSEQRFPRARRVALGYSPVEDRLQLRLGLSDRACVAWLPRRVTGVVIDRLNEALRRSHPAGEGAPAADAVMALEHVAARSELAGQKGAEAQSEQGAGESGQPTDPGEPTAHYLITEARVEAREGQLLIGLLGVEQPTGAGLAQSPEPVAGLSLGRSQAHHFLSMLGEQSRAAQWGLPRSLNWMRRWLTRRRAE